MSDRKPSRDVAISRLPIATMADLIAAREADPTIGPRRKQEDCSAVRSLCRWMPGKPEPDTVPADTRLVKREITRLTPVLCGVSKGRVDTVCSRVRGLFYQYRADLIDTRKAQLLPEWQTLRDATDDGASTWLALGRMPRWASHKGILPTQVDQAMAHRYFSDLVERMFAARPQAAFTGMCRGWKRAATRYPEIWPQVQLDAGDRRKIYVFPQERIDPDFLSDLAAMLARFRNRLDLPVGFTEPLEESTCKEMARVFRRLYSAAILYHLPQPSIRSVADLVKADVVRSILAHYLERFGKDNTRSACKYAHHLYVAAKYWVHAPPEQLAELHRWRRNLNPPRLA